MSTGRTVGVLLLVHLAVGLMLPFMLLDRVRRPPGFLANAALSAGQVRAAVLLLFVGSAVAIGITATAWPVIRRHSSAMALWLFALSVAAFSLQAVDNGAVLSMLSLSQHHAEAVAPEGELFDGLGLVVTSARRWTHFTALLVAVSWIVVLCGVLFRFRLVPRALAAFGVLASLLQIAGVSLRALLGYSPMTVLAVPLAPAYVLLAVWLIAKGFDDRLPADAHGRELPGSNR